jgi:DNA-binding NtrC family response regulator
MSEEQSAAWLQYSVLIVDDEAGMRNFLRRMLEKRCNEVFVAASAEEGAKIIEQHHIDLVILDIALPGRSGLEWLTQLREGGYTGDVILITAFAEMETAIAALRGGASDFILKPFRMDQILNSLKRCFDRARLLRENFVLRRQVAELAGLDKLIGRSPVMQQISNLIKRVAPMPSTVLIQGESGTGKEVVARALHEMSNRAQRPFVPVNCGAIPPEIIESELFGHIKGAFTGAVDQRHGLFFYAQGGTLFLDEISELPLPLQTKLLRVIEDRRIRPLGSEKEVPVDVRIIAATNRNLSEDVASGRFRKDLYFRLDVVSINLPPLRLRPDDIPELAEHFCRQLSAQLGLDPMPLTPAVLQRLRAYSWPGNARELRNWVERSLILGYYAADALPADQSHDPDEPPTAEMPGNTGLFLETVEQQHILHVLALSGGNKSEAARKLGISRKTLDRKLALWE